MMAGALLSASLCACSSSKKSDKAESSDEDDEDEDEAETKKKDKKKKNKDKDKDKEKTKDKDKEKDKDKKKKNGPALRPEHDAVLEEYEKYLLDIGFYHSQEEAEAEDITDTVYIKQSDSEEPEMWYWAVLTALEDDTSVRIERGYGSEEFDSEFSSADTFVSTETLYSGILNEGESIAANLYLGWYGTIRVTVINGEHFGSMLMGEDNWEYKVDEDNFPLPKSIIGKDYDRAGLGAHFTSEDELSSFLAGKWLVVRPDGNGYMATLQFDDDKVRLMTLGRGYEYSIRGLYTIDNQNVPDTISLETEDEATLDELSRYDMWMGKGYCPGGVYHIDAYQLYGAQILTLSHSDPPDTLSYLVSVLDNDGKEPDDMEDPEKEISGRIKLVRFRGVGEDPYVEPAAFNKKAYSKLMGKEPGTWELKAMVNEDGTESAPDKPVYVYFSQCATAAVDGYGRFFIQTEATSNDIIYTGINGDGSYGMEARFDGADLLITIGSRTQVDHWTGRFSFLKETDYNPEW